MRNGIIFTTVVVLLLSFTACDDGGTTPTLGNTPAQVLETLERAFQDRDTELLDRVDIGDPVSEATHSLSEWGPIQPDASGGYYGDLANGGSPDYTSVDKKCRVTHFHGGA